MISQYHTVCNVIDLIDRTFSSERALHLTRNEECAFARADETVCLICYLAFVTSVERTFRTLKCKFGFCQNDSETLVYTFWMIFLLDL